MLHLLRYLRQQDCPLQQLAPSQQSLFTLAALGTTSERTNDTPKRARVTLFTRVLLKKTGSQVYAHTDADGAKSATRNAYVWCALNPENPIPEMKTGIIRDRRSPG